MSFLIKLFDVKSFILKEQYALFIYYLLGVTMFKNKKLVGLLICICLLFCSIFAITLTSSSNLDSSKNIKETKVQQESKKLLF